MYRFTASIEIIGVNPFVLLPEKILRALLTDAGKEKGPVPVKGTINDAEYKQTLVRFKGEWRLYINTSMLRDSPKRLGEKIKLTIAVDTENRAVPLHPELKKALEKNNSINTAFHALTPSRQKEINRYLFHLKSPESVQRNIVKILQHLQGKQRFAGRD